MTLKFERTGHLEARAASGATEVEMAISSEAPYERWFGIEILRHSPDAVDLSRLNDGRHPLLVNHDRERQAGVIKKAWLAADKRLRGLAKFSRSALGKEIAQDVEDGIRTLVSVGYEILEIEEVEPGDKAGKFVTLRKLTGEEFMAQMRREHGDQFSRAGPSAWRAGGSPPPTFVVTRWKPYEASLVAIPADVDVGVGRADTSAASIAARTRNQPGVFVMSRTEEIEQLSPQENAKAVGEIAHIYAKYLRPGDLANAVREAWPLERFKDLILQRMETSHTDTRALHIGMTAKEVKRYSLGRALQAMLTGDWSKAGLERECSEAMARLGGRRPEGFFLPFETFSRDFNVGTGTEAGNLVATDLRGDMFADVFRNKLVFSALGARILTGLTGNVDIPIKTTPTSLGRLTEIGSASETQPATAKVTLSPRRVSGYVEVSKQALIQSAIPLEAMIRDDLLMSAAVELEDQAINGNGTAPNILGIRNYTTIGSTTAGANGAAPTWAHFVDLESACGDANAEPESLAGYITNSKVRGKLKQTQMGTNLPFIWQNGGQPVNGYRVGITNNVPSNLTKGTSTTVCSAAIFSSDWSQMVIAHFGAPDVIVDPYTKADTGQVKITLNIFSDMAVRQAAAFAKIVDLLA